MRGYDLREWRIEAALEEVLKVLQIADLACNLEPLAVCGSSLIEKLDCLVSVIDCLIED